MIDINAIITITPPILTAIFAYLLARKKNALNVKMNKAKIDAEIQGQALSLVRSVMNDMRDEFRKEIKRLTEENNNLKAKIEDTERNIITLNRQIKTSDDLIATLKSEISTLKSTIKIYEDEIARLKQ
jgi:peptidoglycan hydrolase CwlO-like protein